MHVPGAGHVDALHTKADGVGVADAGAGVGDADRAAGQLPAPVTYVLPLPTGRPKLGAPTHDGCARPPLALACGAVPSSYHPQWLSATHAEHVLSASQSTPA